MRSMLFALGVVVIATAATLWLVRVHPAAADDLAAQHTPEVFVLDGGHVLRYRGRIDDAYYARLKKNLQITNHDLHQSLTEMLASKAVSTPATLPMGCPINRVVASPLPNP